MPVQQPLIPRKHRSGALVAVGLAVLVIAILAVMLHGRRHTAVDDSITQWIYLHFRSPWLARALLLASEPALDATVLAVLAVGALVRRAWNVAVLAVVGPVAAVLVSELALKPVVHRQLGGNSFAVANAFPSGHETGVVAVVTVLVVLILRSGWRTGTQIAIVAALGLWALVAAVGLVRNYMHYPSDTVGGAGVAVAVVLATAIAIDAFTGRRRPTADPITEQSAATAAGP